MVGELDLAMAVVRGGALHPGLRRGAWPAGACARSGRRGAFINDSFSSALLAALARIPRGWRRREAGFLITTRGRRGVRGARRDSRRTRAGRRSGGIRFPRGAGASPTAEGKALGAARLRGCLAAPALWSSRRAPRTTREAGGRGALRRGGGPWARRRGVALAVGGAKGIARRRRRRRRPRRAPRARACEPRGSASAGEWSGSGRRDRWSGRTTRGDALPRPGGRRPWGVRVDEFRSGRLRGRRGWRTLRRVPRSPASAHSPDAPEPPLDRGGGDRGGGKTSRAPRRAGRVG